MRLTKEERYSRCRLRLARRQSRFFKAIENAQPVFAALVFPNLYGQYFLTAIGHPFDGAAKQVLQSVLNIRCILDNQDVRLRLLVPYYQLFEVSIEKM